MDMNFNKIRYISLIKYLTTKITLYQFLIVDHHFFYSCTAFMYIYTNILIENKISEHKMYYLETIFCSLSEYR